MRRLETVLLGLFGACWVVLVLTYAGVVRLAESLPLGLYPLYGAAGMLGSLAGNLAVWRSIGVTPEDWRRLKLVYYVGPSSLPMLLRALAPLEVRAAAPFAGLWAVGVYTIFYLVPVSMRRVKPRPPAGPR